MGNPTRLQPTRVLIADDHDEVRRELRLVLEAEPDFEVVAEAADGTAAVEQALAPDVQLAILDVAMPGTTGLDAARELSRHRPELPVLMLTIYDNEDYVFEALDAGASGYLLKSVADRDLVQACRAAVRGEAFLPPGAVSALIRSFLDHEGDADGRL